MVPSRPTLETKLTNDSDVLVPVPAFSPLEIVKSILSAAEVRAALRKPSMKGTLVPGGKVLVGQPFEGKLACQDPRFGDVVWTLPSGVRVLAVVSFFIRFRFLTSTFTNINARARRS